MTIREKCQWIWQDGQDVCLRVKTRPGMKRTSLARSTSHLTIEVGEKAEQGRANEELLAFVALLLKKERSSLAIIHGHTSRTKVLVVKKSEVSEVKGIIDRELRVI